MKKMCRSDVIKCVYMMFMPSAYPYQPIASKQQPIQGGIRNAKGSLGRTWKCRTRPVAPAGPIWIRICRTLWPLTIRRYIIKIMPKGFSLKWRQSSGRAAALVRCCREHDMGKWWATFQVYLLAWRPRSDHVLLRPDTVPIGLANSEKRF